MPSWSRPRSRGCPARTLRLSPLLLSEDRDVIRFEPPRSIDRASAVSFLVPPLPLPSPRPREVGDEAFSDECPFTSPPVREDPPCRLNRPCCRTGRTFLLPLTPRLGKNPPTVLPRGSSTNHSACRRRSRAFHRLIACRLPPPAPPPPSPFDVIGTSSFKIGRTCLPAHHKLVSPGILALSFLCRLVQEVRQCEMKTIADRRVSSPSC